MRAAPARKPGVRDRVTAAEHGNTVGTDHKKAGKLPALSRLTQIVCSAYERSRFMTSGPPTLTADATLPSSSMRIADGVPDAPKSDPVRKD